MRVSRKTKAWWLLALVAAWAPVAACSSSPADTASNDGNVNTPLCGTSPAGTAVAAPLTACPAGFADCDHDPSNGCEADLTTDLAHCGVCGQSCSAVNGAATCTAGACTIACAAGFADCDGDAANGCESNLSTDPLHCGKCAVPCSSNNGLPSCAAGACHIACDPGFGDCDGVETNGCETDTATSLVDCGTCGNVCVAFNGAASCAGGFCSLTCGAGFGDCDKNAQNGCETDTNTSAANCGACGNACNAVNGTASCTAGACTLHCGASFSDCDKNAANGCEAALQTDPANCGTCGTVCGSQNGIDTCSAGACLLQCSGGYGDCDGLASNGCEIDLTSNASNCGGCGTVCPVATPTCVNGACQ